MPHGHRITRTLGAAVIVVAGLAVPTAAGAAPYPDGGTPPPPNNEASVIPNRVTRTAATLPFTGGDVLGLAAIGTTMIGTGVVLRRRARTR